MGVIGTIKKHHKQAGKVIKKVGKAHVAAGAAAASGGMSIIARKLLNKKNTNVTKATKQQRRERIDKNAGTRTPEAQRRVNERRKAIDLKDRERMEKNPKARERVDAQIERRNERLGRNDKTYREQAAQGRGKGGGGRAANFAAMEANKAAEAKQAKKDARKAKRPNLAKLGQAFKDRLTNKFK